jgi:hypothetical protein
VCPPAAETIKWRQITYYVAIPVVIVGMVVWWNEPHPHTIEQPVSPRNATQPNPLPPCPPDTFTLSFSNLNPNPP